MLPRRARNSSSVGSSDVPRSRRTRRACAIASIVRVARLRVQRDAQQVLVDAELVVAEHAAVPCGGAPVPSRACRASSKPGRARPRRRRRSRRRSRRRCRNPRECAATRRAGGRLRGRDGNERAERLVTAIDERPARECRDASLERVVDAHRREHDVRRAEIAAQAPRAALDRLVVSTLGELLEEVLDQVLLRQALEHLDLLDRDRRLVCDRAREIELACPVGDESAEQLVAGDERNRHASGAAAPGRPPGRARSARSPRACRSPPAPPSGRAAARRPRRRR